MSQPKKQVSIVLSLTFFFFLGSAFASFDQASRIKLPVLQGASNPQLSVSDFKGKVVLVDVWASWCGPCRISFPRYQALYEKYASRGFVVVAVNVDADISDAEQFLNSFNVSFVALRDDPAVKSFIKPLGGIETMPTAYLLDRKGNVVKKKLGFTPGDEAILATEIETLLGQ